MILTFRNSLAYVEMRVILARIIWNFDLSLAEESQDWLQRQKVYIFWDKGPLIVNLTPVAHKTLRELEGKGKQWRYRRV